MRDHGGGAGLNKCPSPLIKEVDGIEREEALLLGQPGLQAVGLLSYFPDFGHLPEDRGEGTPLSMALTRGQKLLILCGMAAKVDMEKLVSLCKRRGFIFPGGGIYGGVGGFWGYGPPGGG